jgi:hypothetical protein
MSKASSPVERSRPDSGPAPRQSSDTSFDWDAPHVLSQVGYGVIETIGDPNKDRDERNDEKHREKGFPHRFDG